jgi:hypothetical protein
MRFEPAYKKWKWWSDLRFEVISLAGGICSVCYIRPATQVHHKVYPVGRREQARDLMAICNLCHENAHGLVAANDNEKQEELDYG